MHSISALWRQRQASLRPTWSTQGVPGQPKLHSGVLPQKQNKTTNKKTPKHYIQLFFGRHLCIFLHLTWKVHLQTPPRTQQGSINQPREKDSKTVACHKVVPGSQDQQKEEVRRQEAAQGQCQETSLLFSVSPLALTSLTHLELICSFLLFAHG